MAVRRTPARPAPPVSAAASRRLALIAADLGGDRGDRGDQAVTEEAVTEEAWWADHTRVAAARVGDGPSAAGAAAGEAGGAVRPAEPPALPVPGRHADRRRLDPLGGLRARTTPLGDRLPTLVIGPAQVAVVAIAVALALAVTTWWVLRDRESPMVPVSAEPTAPLVSAAAEAEATASRTPAPAAGASAGAPGASVTVDVAGKVRRPGIVVLDEGARVTDALAAAGGPRRGVDLTPLNLARVLVDGEQIVVGVPGASGAPAAAPGTGGSGTAAAGAGGPLINLNTAGQTELESLPQVGPVTAQSILAWRDTHGGFTSVDELLEIDGIGDKTLAQIKPHVTV